MTNPKILVVICNYNHNHFLKESIESIQNQSYDNLDICVVDDGSDNTDEVYEILGSFKNDSRVRSIFQPNSGKWHALNEAIKSSDADICTSHDADDVSLYDRIRLQFSVLTHTKTYHNLCGFHHCWNEQDVQSRKNFRHEGPCSFLDAETVSKHVNDGFTHPNINHYYTGQFETAGVSAMFYKDLWTRGLRFNPPGLGLRVLLSEDSDFNFRVTQTYGKTSIVTEQLYLYRRNTSTNQELS